MIFEVSDGNSALEQAILELPDSWEGVVEIHDDATLNHRKYSL